MEWVFTYGDIVNLHLNNEFYTETDQVEIENVETIRKDEKVLVAQPSESYLPRQARNVIKKFLQNNGVQQPQIMMISRKKAGAVIQELAFNLFAEDFSSHDDLNDLMQELSWFLPRHYIILSVPRSSNLAAHFEDL